MDNNNEKKLLNWIISVCNEVIELGIGGSVILDTKARAEMALGSIEVLPYYQTGKIISVLIGEKEEEDA